MSKKFAAKIILSFLALGIFLLPVSGNFEKRNGELSFNTQTNKAEATDLCEIHISAPIIEQAASDGVKVSIKINVDRPSADNGEGGSPAVANDGIITTGISPLGTLGGCATSNIATDFEANSWNAVIYNDVPKDQTSGLFLLPNDVLFIDIYSDTNSGPMTTVSLHPDMTVGSQTIHKIIPLTPSSTAQTYYVRGRIETATGSEKTENPADFSLSFVQPTDNSQINSTNSVTETSTDKEGSASFDLGCTLTGGWKGIGGCIAAVFYYVFFVPIAALAHLAAILLDFFVNYSTSSSSYGVGGFVAVGWAAVRDIANIFFIIGLLAVAIQTILGIGHHTKQMIGHIILAAMLINFSLFFSQVVIDGTNILAKVFYNHISVTDKSGGELVLGANGEKQISVQIISAFDPQNILGQQEYNNMGLGRFIFIVLLCSAIVLYTAYIFFTVALLFVTRVAMLCLLMVFAPIAFASYALPFKIPGLGHEDWWDQLLKNAFLAPIFIFFLYIILTLINALKMTNFNASTDSTFGTIMQTMIPFLIIAILLKKSKEMAEEYSGEMGHAVGGIGGKLATAAIGGTVGAYATLGKATLGRVGDKISNSSRVRDLGATKYGGWLGKGIQNAGKAVGNASFDVRGAGVAGIGTAAVGGFTAVKEKQVNERKQRAKDLEESQYSKSQKDIDKAKAEVHNQEAHAAPAIHDVNVKIEDKTAKIEEIKKKIIEPEEKNVVAAEKSVKDAERNLKIAVDTHGQGSQQAKDAGIEVRRQVNIRDKAIERKNEIEKTILKPETAQLDFLIQDLKKLNEPIKQAKNNLHHAEQAQTDINHKRRDKYASNVEFVKGNRNPFTQFVTVITGGSVMANNKGASEIRANGQPSGHSDDHGGGGKKRPPFKGKKTGGHGAPAGGHDDHH